MSSPGTLGPLLLVGPLSVPTLFGWLLLRRGYASSPRRIVSDALVAVTGVGLLGRLPE